MLFLLLAVAGGLRAQPIDARDCAMIRDQAEETLQSLASLLNHLSDPYFAPTEYEDLKRNAYDAGNVARLFYHGELIIEDDLLPVGPPGADGGLNDKKVGRYLDDFDLLYAKSEQPTVFFSNLHAGPILVKDYILLHVLYDSALRGKLSQQPGRPLPSYRRVATFRAERVDGRWRTYIQQINFFRTQYDFVARHRDGDCDGIPDEDDACPATPGSPETDGCPGPRETDSDQDGVVDADDQCPETPGMPENNGCPGPWETDSDLDGVVDAEDRCPDRAGPWCSGGCPPPLPAVPLFREVLWEERYGNPGADAAYDILRNERGELVFAGETDIAGQGKQLFLAVLDPCRKNIRRSLILGGAQDDGARKVLQLAPDRYAVAGYTESSGSGSREGWLVLTDSLQETQEWLFGSNRSDDAFLDLARDPAGSLLLTGYRGNELWLLRLSVDGEVLDEVFYGDRGRTRGTALAVASDGAVYVTGYATYGGSDRLLVLRYDETARRLRPLFEKEQARGHDLLVDGEGQLLVAGACYTPRTRDDIFVARLTPQGRLHWELAPAFGGTGIDAAGSILETGEGNYLLSGYSSSYAEGARSEKLWAQLLSRRGEPQWPEPIFYGHRFANRIYALAPLGPGQAVAAGVTQTSGREQDAEFWLVGLNTEVGKEKAESGREER